MDINWSWTYQDISQILAALSGATILLGLYLQAWKVYKTKSVGDFSALLVVAVLVDNLIWVNYGWFAAPQFALKVITAVGFPPAVALVVLYFKYRHNPRTDHPPCSCSKH